MGRFREQLRHARGTLHKTMSVPAYYFAKDSDEFTLITVRVHNKFGQLGDQKGTNFNYAEVEDNTPQIVFLRSEITPKRNMIVSVEVGEAYRVDTVLPSEDITITARVVRLRPEDTLNFPVPSL